MHLNEETNINPCSVTAEALVNVLLNQRWHKGCLFVADYLVPKHEPGEPPRIRVKYVPYEAYLRYSQGPQQGFFWDVYGDDMLTLELAILALHQAPAPIDVRPLTFNMDLPKKSA
jgi:hypothetical protein